MEQWMIEELEQYYAEQEVMKEIFEDEENLRIRSHDPSTCFCTEHWG